jgi:nucleoside phosphorylase
MRSEAALLPKGVHAVVTGGDPKRAAALLAKQDGEVAGVLSFGIAGGLDPDLAPGDLVAVAATGAYCYAMASNYNRIPRPPVVAVTDAQSRVIIRRETLEQLMANDVGWSPAEFLVDGVGALR